MGMLYRTLWRAAVAVAVCLGLMGSMVPAASAASTLLTPSNPSFTQAVSDGLASATHSWEQLHPGEPSPFASDFGMSLSRHQPTSSPLQGIYDDVVAVRLSSGVEVHVGLTSTGDRVETGLRILGGAGAFTTYSLTSTVSTLTDGSLLSEVTDSLGQRVEEVIAALPASRAACSSDSTCALVGVGISAGGAVACAGFTLGGPLGWLAGLTCGLIFVVLGTGGGVVCQSLVPGCNFGASLSVNPTCRDWYCTMVVVGVNSSGQPFRESHTIMSWRRSDGTDAYIQGHIETRHSDSSPTDGVTVSTQNFEISAPRDTVRCTTEVWMYTHGRWVNETVTSPQVDVPKVNTYC